MSTKIRWRSPEPHSVLGGSGAWHITVDPHVREADMHARWGPHHACAYECLSLVSQIILQTVICAHSPGTLLSCGLITVALAVRLQGYAEFLVRLMAVLGGISSMSLPMSSLPLTVSTVCDQLGHTFTLRKAQEQDKKVVLAGCVPQAQPRMDYLKGLSIIGVQQIDRVVEVVDETVKGHSVRLLGQKKEKGKRLGGARLDLPKIRKNPLIEIISINTGDWPPVLALKTGGVTSLGFTKNNPAAHHSRFPFYVNILIDRGAAAARAHTSQGNLTANAPASYLERVDSPSSSVSDSLQGPRGTQTDLRPAISRSHLPPLICPFVRQIPQHTGGLIRNQSLSAT
ncbi:Threonylcarbamoyladenosine tRNA methylthiotransferase [Triplophysa tibetana]|uniref:Threonylcarbamoyladenosine tRNA methylthiotransferase n=1 Tax=Triplophysa tibetana TaxID=1572043 RepID=A0A5A9N1R4_9TELE|nr:Threonylcarbamoyladenosine tRNA methylthiotransferase [Triplophysa tibetana]